MSRERTGGFNLSRREQNFLFNLFSREQLISADPPSLPLQNHPRKELSTMSARRAIGNIARRRLVPPKPQKTYVRWYMKWADVAHKAVVLTCVGVTRNHSFRIVVNNDSVLRCRSGLHVHPKSKEQRRITSKTD
jgi:hypothetical protein